MDDEEARCLVDYEGTRPFAAALSGLPLVWDGTLIKS